MEIAFTVFLLVITHDGRINSRIYVSQGIDNHEYIRDSILRDEDDNLELESTRIALIEGEVCGEPRHVDVNTFKATMMDKQPKINLTDARSKSLYDTFWEK